MKHCSYKTKNTKDCQQPPEAKKGKGRFLSKILRRNISLTIPKLQNYGRIYLF